MSGNSAQPNMRTYRWTPYAVVILCFFLPFVQMSCRDVKIFSVTGLQLVAGAEMEQPAMFGQAPKKAKVDPEPWAILAFLCALAGTALCFVRAGAGNLLAAIAGGFGFVSMLLLKARIDDQVLKQGVPFLRIDYEIGFIGACILFAVGAAITGYLFSQGKTGPDAAAAKGPEL